MNETNLLSSNSNGDDGDSSVILAERDVKMSSLEIWGYGFLFVTIINFSSVMGIIFFPLMKKSFYTIVMRCMIGLAIGSLSGSALFHLIPQAFGLARSDHRDYMSTASFIWLAIWIVMNLECTIKILVKTKAINRRKKQKLEELQNGENFEISKSNENRTTNGANGIAHYEGVSADSTSEPLNSNNETTSNNEKTPTIPHNQSKMDIYHSTLSLNRQAVKYLTISSTDEDDKSIKTVAWIVIIGDSLHNFIDGVSIGAGFTQSFSTGLILSLAVICEEFPHELGDFAILINSGLSVRKAITFNFLSALTCYLGLCLGIILGKIEFENLIFAFAAGIFLYVSLADMMPEVTAVIDEVCDISPKQAWFVLVNHNVGILIGIVILFILAIHSPA